MQSLEESFFALEKNAQTEEKLFSNIKKTPTDKPWVTKELNS